MRILTILVCENEKSLMFLILQTTLSILVHGYRPELHDGHSCTINNFLDWKSLKLRSSFVYSSSNKVLILLISDDWQNLASTRPIMQHQLLFSGNDIFLDKSPESIGKSYSVLLEQEVFVQNDPSKNCKNYPTSNYHCYKVSPVVVT